MNITEIKEATEKQKICRAVLEQLTEWFEVEEAREKYIRDCAGQVFFAAFDGDIPAGFITLETNGRETAEIHVMGVGRKYRHQGIGTRLFEAAREKAARLGILFLQVKTVQMGKYPEYDETNRFYLSLGFHEFEVLPELWGAENPCQVYVMFIGNQ